MDIKRRRKSKALSSLPFRLLDQVPLLIHEPLRAHHFERVMQRIQRRLRRPVRAETAVRPGEVLAIIDGEVHVVQGVVGGAVDELFRPVAGDHVAVVDQDGPDLDGHEEDHVQISLHGADEDEEAFGERLLAGGDDFEK